MTDGKSPTQVIEDALNRLSGAVTVFRDEKTALSWVRNASTGLMRHKMRMMGLSPEERDVMDPIEAGFIHAADLGTKPRQVRRPWIDALLNSVADACACQVIPMKGTISSWLVGRQTDRQVAKHMLSGLVPTCEKLSETAYYNEYRSNVRAGTVEGARGFREKWQDRFVADVTKAFRASKDELTQELPQIPEVMHDARQEVVRFMNDNFLPTRGDRTERLATPRKGSTTNGTGAKDPASRSRHRK